MAIIGSGGRADQSARGCDSFVTRVGIPPDIVAVAFVPANSLGACTVASTRSRPLESPGKPFGNGTAALPSLNVWSVPSLMFPKVRATENVTVTPITGRPFEVTVPTSMSCPSSVERASAIRALADVNVASAFVAAA